LIVVIYVDDILALSNRSEILDKLVSYIRTKWKCKDYGELEFMVGIRYTREKHDGITTMYADQITYIEKVLESFEMLDCQPAPTPATSIVLTEEMNATTVEDQAVMRYIPYRSAVGSLMYAAIGTRPDISNAVRCVARHMQNPGPLHWRAVKRILRYLRGTKHYKLRLGPANSTMADNTLVGYVDADYAGDINTSRSTSGFVFMLGPSLISWASRLQSVVAKSTTEAEYMSLDEGISEVLYLLQLLKDVGMEQQTPITIYEDNSGAISLANNPQFQRRTRHIRVRYHYIRECICNGTVQLQYINTKEQLADALTKNVDTKTLKHFVNMFFKI
jgi:Reverse transcriptase (RNA-dependent DNA polymerase)